MYLLWQIESRQFQILEWIHPLIPAGNGANTTVADDDNFGARAGCCKDLRATGRAQRQLGVPSEKTEARKRANHAYYTKTTKKNHFIKMAMARFLQDEERQREDAKGRALARILHLRPEPPTRRRWRSRVRVGGGTLTN